MKVVSPTGRATGACAGGAVLARLASLSTALTRVHARGLAETAARRLTLGKPGKESRWVRLMQARRTQAKRKEAQQSPSQSEFVWEAHEAISQRAGATPGEAKAQSAPRRKARPATWTTVNSHDTTYPSSHAEASRRLQGMSW